MRERRSARSKKSLVFCPSDASTSVRGGSKQHSREHPGKEEQKHPSKEEQRGAKGHDTSDREQAMQKKKRQASSQFGTAPAESWNTLEAHLGTAPAPISEILPHHLSTPPALSRNCSRIISEMLSKFTSEVLPHHLRGPSTTYWSCSRTISEILPKLISELLGHHL